MFEYESDTSAYGEIPQVFDITVPGNLLLERLSWVVDGINRNISKEKIHQSAFLALEPRRRLNPRLTWLSDLLKYLSKPSSPVPLNRIKAGGNEAIRGCRHENKCQRRFLLPVHGRRVPPVNTARGAVIR